MAANRLRFLAVCLALPLVGQDADLVLRGGVVWTGEDKSTAVAVKGNKIVALGAAAAQMKAGRVVELKGRFAMPGFNDADLRFVEGAVRSNQLDLTGICSVSGFQKAIRDYAILHPEKAWITGSGWELQCFPNFRLPSRQVIDEVVPDRPVYLTAYGERAGWANSKALESFQRAHEIQEGQWAGGLFTGEPSERVKRGIPEPSREEKLVALVGGMKIAASKGITSIQPTVRSKEEAELFVTLFEQKRLLLRTSIAIDADAKTDLTRLEALRKRYQSPMLAVRGLSFALDGKIPEKSAAMLAPFEGEAHGGAVNFTETDFERAMKRADAAGWQVRMHASGDKAVRLALNEYETAMKWNKTKGARHRLEDVGVSSPEDMARFAGLGVVAVVRPGAADVGKLAQWSKVLGGRRMELALPWASLGAAGARLAFASDWKGALPLNPLQGISQAVNRTGRQRLTLAQALRAYTAGGGYASGEEKIKGKLLVGQLADIAVLDRDPFVVPVMEKVKVVMTILDGRIVFGKD